MKKHSFIFFVGWASLLVSRQPEEKDNTIFCVQQIIWDFLNMSAQQKNNKNSTEKDINEEILVGNVKDCQEATTSGKKNQQQEMSNGHHLLKVV